MIEEDCARAQGWRRGWRKEGKRMGRYFGTDGFRGEANVDLTVEHAYQVGRFLGWYYGQKKEDTRCRVVIGKDTREYSNI